jgi:methionyl-tRNA formyltransferase
MSTHENSIIGLRKDTRTRIVLFGMRCAFTAPILDELASSVAIDVLAVVFPATGQVDTRDHGRASLGAAVLHGIPTIELAARSDLTADAFRASLERLAPDLIVTACFPWRLPGRILALPAWGCLNVHPSLLPVGRGPEPIFWAFRWGLETTGITLHLMDEALDTGPIMAQRRFNIPLDATMITLEQTLARIGAEMLREYLAESPLLMRRSYLRDESQARYGRFPREEDLVVPTSWTAAAAARFVHAVIPEYGEIPILVLATGQRIAVNEVRHVDEDGSMPTPVVITGDSATIQFSEGVLECRLRSTRQPLLLHAKENPTPRDDSE